MAEDVDVLRRFLASGMRGHVPVDDHGFHQLVMREAKRPLQV